jgi:hypothetical protein
MRECIPPLPHYAFMAWFLVKHRDKFTFTVLHTSAKTKKKIYLWPLEDIYRSDSK